MTKQAKEDRVREAADRLLNHFSGHQSQPGTQREVVERELRAIASLPAQPQPASSEFDRGLEEAAKVADRRAETAGVYADYCRSQKSPRSAEVADEKRRMCEDIAAAIRAMKGGTQ